MHVHDLVMLPTTCPYQYNEFKKGKFAVQISHRKFSKIHYDHAHEQSNKTIKSSSGTIDLVNRVNEEVQRRWEIAGPEISEYLENVEEYLHPSKNAQENHHEDSVSANKWFCDDYMIIKPRLMHNNPFEADAFVRVGTNYTFPKAVVEYAKLIPDIGNQQYEEFTRERLIYGQKAVSDRIKLSRFALPTTKINEDENDRKVLKSETFNKL